MPAIEIQEPESFASIRFDAVIVFTEGVAGDEVQGVDVAPYVTNVCTSDLAAYASCAISVSLGLTGDTICGNGYAIRAIQLDARGTPGPSRGLPSESTYTFDANVVDLAPAATPEPAAWRALSAAKHTRRAATASAWFAGPKDNTSTALGKALAEL